MPRVIAVSNVRTCLLISNECLSLTSKLSLGCTSTVSISGSCAATTSSSGRHTDNGDDDDEEDVGEGGRGASRGLFC